MFRGTAARLACLRTGGAFARTPIRRCAAAAAAAEPAAPSSSAEDPSKSVNDYTPRQVLAILDKFVIGQDKAKRAVAVALRNRW
eukprot:CAMPEP_0174831790 /NCGR_PEP_ID=MMETSP1114-20130205/3309_1 /TAXON_ID=312471 /ORGANISM="Neobodo designis, Strain CCAP 1951/1" /LENGTH=83 /DNA_ID=CAMNT_0016065633 /DNA_START=41 /DNA_END=289 /DNA_ORIENTATION=+